MKALLFGANGQLGKELIATCPEYVLLRYCDSSQADFTRPETIARWVEAENCQTIINAAAYTAVDRAENDREKAFCINHHAVGTLAELSLKYNIFLVHVSTDFVFNGRNYKPYSTKDSPDPVSLYGLSKYEGEKAISEILGNQALMIRTAWLYSKYGKNFVKTMLNAMESKESLSVIDEQIGTPTWARGLARAIWRALDQHITGIVHWTDAGVASWYDFAVAIQEEALGLGLLSRKIPIRPVKTESFPTPAARPFYSVLDKHDFWDALGLCPYHWREQLRSMLQELP